MNYHIRTISLQDKEEFLRLLLQYVKEYIPSEHIYPVKFNPEIAPAYWKFFVENQDKNTIIVAEQGEKLIGFCLGEIHFYEELEKLYYVGDRRGDASDLYTIPDSRGIGVGGALLTGLGEEFKKRGCEHMILNNVDIENHGAKKLYKTLGYKPWTMKFYKKII